MICCVVATAPYSRRDVDHHRVKMIYMARPMKSGWVYIFTNKAMPGIVKVGYTTRHPNKRARDLSQSGVPYPYVVEYAVRVTAPYPLEQRVHHALSHCREGKEWFRCSVEHAREVIQKKADSIQREIVRGREIRRTREKEGTPQPVRVPRKQPPTTASRATPEEERQKGWLAMTWGERIFYGALLGLCYYVVYLFFTDGISYYK